MASENNKSVVAGPLQSVELSGGYLDEVPTTTQLLMTNEALAIAALMAGVNVVAGYPGTPSSEIVETVAKRRAKGCAHGVHVEWSTNEKAALELAAAATYCGARALFTCKQVGLNVASDPLMSLNYVGVKGGLVVLVADDPGPISSQTEQDTRRFASFAKIPVLDPATPEQAFAMMQQAFELSERYRTPVIVRPTTRVDHASAFFNVPLETFARELPEQGFEKSIRWGIFPARSYEAHGEINQRLKDIADDFATLPEYASFNEVTRHASCAAAPTKGIMAGGVSAAYAQEALRMLQDMCQQTGRDFPAYAFMQVGTPYPFPAKAVAQFSEGLTDILVLEELDNVLEDELLIFAGRTHASFEVHGKLTDEALARGENSVEDCIGRIAAYVGFSLAETPFASLEQRPAESAEVATKASCATEAKPLEIPTRPPVLCAGCPHRASFYAVKRALGKREAILCGDIGCYTLGNAAPLNMADTCLCMGAGITMAQGFNVIEEQLAAPCGEGANAAATAANRDVRPCVAFVGDSTFFASAMTGIANAVYNEHDITVCVLDNSTTAMTGAQPHPGTGVTLMGSAHEGISSEAVVRALGVQCVRSVNPLDLPVAIKAAKEAIDFPGPSVVIFKSPCVQLIKPAQAFWVDTHRCTGCKRCISEIGCPAIGFNPAAEGPASAQRGQAFVDASLCNGCGLCAQVCPSGVLVCEKSEATASGAAASGVAATDATAGDAADVVATDTTAGEKVSAAAKAGAADCGADADDSAKAGERNA